MKRIALFLAILIASTSTAMAAPKSVTMKKLRIIATINAEAILVSGKTIISISTTEGANSNILLTGMDSSGAQLWQKLIDSGVDEVALTSGVDVLGNLWIAGASSVLSPAESTTVQVQAENPDGVILEQVSRIRSDMNVLTLWKVSPLGELMATYSAPQTAPALINALSVNSSGVSVVGQVNDKAFLLSATPTGTFGKMTVIGTTKTQLNGVVRNSDGTVSIFGSSSETLGGKKLAGARDGVLIKVSKNRAIASVVRSSAPKADRSWLTADSSLALTGYVKSGKVTETAFTKFTAAFVPTWTTRVPSTGSSLVVSAGSNTYGAFGSSAAIAGVSGWKPPTPSVALLAFDSKGLVTNAYGSTEICEPISLAYSKDLGVIGLARTANQTLSLFTLS